MRAEPLNLDHRSLLQDRLRAVEVPISEYSFANLYLFRDTHKYELLRDGDDIWLRGVSYDGHPYMMPTRDLRDVDPDRLFRMVGMADYLFPVPDEWLPAFPAGWYSLSHDEGESDYLYETRKIATFAGKKLHKKKNLLNFFLKHYIHDAKPLTSDRVPDALAILDSWQVESGVDRSETDFYAAREALEMMDELVLCGGIWYSDGQPSGYILGEELSLDTFALHFAKGLTRFKGIYQYIFSSFASVLPSSYKHLNMEQDLGKEALKHSKESYYPEIKRIKYRISSRNT